MIANEPASGYNLPPGCLDDDIERAYGGEAHPCAECRHCDWSDALGCLVCVPRLEDAAAGLEGGRLRPRHVLAAVEGAVVDGCDGCGRFEW